MFQPWLTSSHLASLTRATPSPPAPAINHLSVWFSGDDRGCVVCACSALACVGSERSLQEPGPRTVVLNLACQRNLSWVTVAPCPACPPHMVIFQPVSLAPGHWIIMDRTPPVSPRLWVRHECPRLWVEHWFRPTMVGPGVREGCRRYFCGQPQARVSKRQAQDTHVVRW